MSTEAHGPLSLAEAMALIGGERVDVDEVVFLALLELVAREAVEIVPLSGASEYALRPIDASRVTSRPLVRVVELLREAIDIDPRGAAGITSAKYIERCFAARWGTAGGFVRLEVWATLKQRGLSGGKLGLRTAAIWTLTERGAKEKQRILESGTREDWRERPGTTLLRAAGLPVPSDETFEILDELEDGITPGVAYDPLAPLDFLGPPGVP